MDYFIISPEEKEYLRELARQQLEYARLPVMEERRQAWYAHNKCQGSRPMIVIEEGTFWPDVRQPARCAQGAAHWLEDQLRQNIFVYEKLADDKVIPDFVSVPFKIDSVNLGVHLQRHYASDGIGFHIEPILNSLPGDLEKLGHSIHTFDSAATKALVAWVAETVGDILPPRLMNTTNHWFFGLTNMTVNLMGMEGMFVAMMDEPDAFHQLMRLITDDMIRFLRWEEENKLLLVNNGNDYMGSGSFCFTDELPQKDFTGSVRSVDTWGHLNSQESIGLSPAMYDEYIFPYYIELAKEFGLVYYGCCEPVDTFWEQSICRLPNLRKVSISPWCNEEFMASRLAGGKIIYSRKPSPNFLGVQQAFDEAAFSSHIQKTVDLARNCTSEYIFRDIYNLHGNLDKVKKAVQIVRQLTNG